MRNLYKFIDFMKEELRIDKMDPKSLEQVKKKILKRINEYRNFILDNIEYDLKTNKIVYKDFEEIDVDLIMKELNTEFTPEVIEDLNIDTLLRKVNQLLELRRRNTKKNIRKQFDDFANTIDKRISVITTGEQSEHFDEIERDMNHRNSISRRKEQTGGLDSKTRKKREELSVSATKSIKKEDVQIVVTFK